MSNPYRCYNDDMFFVASDDMILLGSEENVTDTESEDLKKETVLMTTTLTVTQTRSCYQTNTILSDNVQCNQLQSFKYFRKLPAEVQRVIFSVLDEKDLYSMRQVSRGCRKIADSIMRSMKYCVLAVDNSWSFEKAECISTLFCNARFLDVCFGSEYRADNQSFTKVQRLVEIIVSQSEFINTVWLRNMDSFDIVGKTRCMEFIEMMSRKLVFLETLGIQGYISNSLLCNVLCQLGQKLKSLSLNLQVPYGLVSYSKYDCEMTSFSFVNTCRQLKELYVSYSDSRCATYFSQKTRGLEKFVFCASNQVLSSSVSSFIDASIFAIRMPNLNYLKLHGESIIHVAMIATQLKLLKKLSLSVYSMKITSFANIMFDAKVLLRSDVINLTVNHPLATSKLLTWLKRKPLASCQRNTCDLFNTLRFPLLQRLKLKNTLPTQVADFDYDYPEQGAIFPFKYVISRFKIANYLQCRNERLVQKATEHVFLRVIHYALWCCYPSPNCGMMRALFSGCDTVLSNADENLLKTLWREACGNKSSNYFDEILWNGRGLSNAAKDGQHRDCLKETELHLYISLTKKYCFWGDYIHIFVFEVLRYLYERCAKSFSGVAAEIAEGQSHVEGNSEKFKMKQSQKRSDNEEQLLTKLNNIIDVKMSQRRERGFSDILACGTLNEFCNFSLQSTILSNLLAFGDAVASSVNAGGDIVPLQNVAHIEKSITTNFSNACVHVNRIALFGKLFRSIVVENETCLTAFNRLEGDKVTYAIYAIECD